MLLFPQFWSDFAGQRSCPYLFHFYKVCQSSIQSDNSIRSYRVCDLLQTDGQTDGFSDSGGLKTWRYDGNSESDFSHKTNTFSYDENVKKSTLEIITENHKSSFFYEMLSGLFLKIWKIQQKTIKNVYQFRLNENFANFFTVNCNCR